MGGPRLLAPNRIRSRRHCILRPLKSWMNFLWPSSSQTLIKGVFLHHQKNLKGIRWSKEAAKPGSKGNRAVRHPPRQTLGLTLSPLWGGYAHAVGKILWGTDPVEEGHTGGSYRLEGILDHGYAKRGGNNSSVAQSIMDSWGREVGHLRVPMSNCDDVESQLSFRLSGRMSIFFLGLGLEAVEL